MKKNKKKLLKLEYLRKKYGFTQNQMASLIGVKQAGYSHKVNRKTPITFDEMLIIMAALNKKAIKEGDNELSLDNIFLD